MKVVLILACLVAFASSSISKENTPTFTLLEDRLDNAPPPGARSYPPKISITFPDGYTDNLILDHFYPEEDKIEGCQFIGHLEKEQEACVAMSGCIGSEDVQFTIMSDHVTESSLLKWKKDGSVEHIKSPYKSKGIDPNMRRGNTEEEEFVDGDLRDPVQNAKEFKIEQNIIKAGGWTSVQLPANMKMQIKVAYDYSIRNKMGSDQAVKQYYHNAAPHLQANYCHSSFPTKIKIEKVGDFIFVPGNIDASEKSIADLRSFTEQNLGYADLIVYMCADPTHSGYAGLAPIGTVCRPNVPNYSMGGIIGSTNSFKMCLCEHEQDNARFGRLMSHEIGHNIGLFHDFDKRHGGNGNQKSNGWPNGRAPYYCETDKSIMSYSSSEIKWTQCNKLDFEAHYLNCNKMQSWCMDVLNGNACSGATPAPAPSPTPCQDINSNCPNWKVHCSSASYGPWMTQNCAKTCGKCGGGGNACTKTDNSANCANWKVHCNSATYGAWMKQNCAKTCTC